MIRNLLCSFVLVFASMAALSEAEADLIINFDPNSNELFFSGQDSGTPDVTTAFAVDLSGGDFSFIEVDTFSIFFGNATEDVPFNAINLQISSGSSALTADGAAILGTFTSIPGEGLGAGISLGIPRLENGELLTITGDEDVRFDISSSDADALAFLASLNGTTVSRFTPFGGTRAGTGFEEVRVNVLPVVAVPEPAAATLLALTGLTLSCRRRRRS